MIDTAILHAKIVAAPLDFLRELYGPEVKPAGTDKWRVGRRGSLAISIKDGALVFYSHEEGIGGDAVALWQRQRGGNAGDALKAAAAWAQVADEKAPWPHAPRREPVARPPVLADEAAPRMTEEQFQQAHAMSKRLATDLELCERIAKARGWKTETIRDLCLDGALGWSDGWTGKHTGALAFCYDSGIKHRWRRGNVRVIRWFCGGPRTLWRAWMILPCIKTVFIVEGETDAISLINAGAEVSLDTLIVAVPNAGVVPHGIGEFVAGRNVVLSLDKDSAGQAASEKLIQVIKPTAGGIQIWKAPK